MILTTLVCLLLSLDQHLSRLDGLILFALFVLYTYFLYWDERKHYQGKPQEEEDTAPKPRSAREAWLGALVAAVAMTVTVFAAQVVLGVTELVVVQTGVGGSFIGVITLGVASALPELTTALAGVRHKEHGISLGTLVGSNITNPLVGIGLGALVSTYWVPRPVLYWDFPAQSITGVIIWLLLVLNKGRLSRPLALVLVVVYILYIALRAIFFLTD
jgi:cation:H+ antiporter